MSTAVKSNPRHFSKIYNASKSIGTDHYWCDLMNWSTDSTTWNIELSLKWQETRRLLTRLRPYPRTPSRLSSRPVLAGRSGNEARRLHRFWGGLALWIEVHDVRTTTFLWSWRGPVSPSLGLKHQTKGLFALRTTVGTPWFKVFLRPVFWPNGQQKSLSYSWLPSTTRSC